MSDILKTNKQSPNPIRIAYHSMPEDAEDISAGKALTEQSSQWHLTAIRYCAQLNINLWDDDLFSFFNKLVKKYCENPVNEEIYNGLIQLTERIAKHNAIKSIPLWDTWLNYGPMAAKLRASEMLRSFSQIGYNDAIQCLFNAVSCENENVAGTVISYLVDIPDEYVTIILCMNIDHPSPIVRRDIAYSLGLFSPRPYTHLSLQELLEDTDVHVCLTAAISLIWDVDSSVENALNLTSTRLSNSYSYDDEEVSDYMNMIFKPSEDTVPQKHHEEYLDEQTAAIIIKKLKYIWQELHTGKMAESILHLVFDRRFDRKYNDQMIQAIKTLKKQLAHHNDFPDYSTARFLDDLIIYGENKQSQNDLL